MNCSMPGFRIHHQLLDFTQTHDHLVGDTIQPSHPLSSPSPPSLNLSQHQGLFQWASSSHQVAKVLEFQLHTSVLPMNTEDCSPLGWTGWISLQSKGLSRVFSNTIVQKHQFFSDCSLRKTFLSLLAILWNSVFRWLYLSFSPLLLASLVFSAIYKASWDTILPFCISFSWGWFWPPPLVQCHEPLFTVLQVLYQIESLESICHSYCIIIRGLI